MASKAWVRSCFASRVGCSPQRCTEPSSAQRGWLAGRTLFLRFMGVGVRRGTLVPPKPTHHDSNDIQHLLPRRLPMTPIVADLCLRPSNFWIGSAAFEPADAPAFSASFFEDPS